MSTFDNFQLQMRRCHTMSKFDNAEFEWVIKFFMLQRPSMEVSPPWI